MTAMLWKYFSITEKWKTPTILYLSLQQKLFSLCWSYLILRPKFWTSWDYSSIHTSFHSVFLQSDVTIKRHHAPLAHALGYTEKEHKKRAAARITVHLLIPNFWARKSNILTRGFVYFCGVEDNFSFPSMLPKHTYSQTKGRWVPAVRQC